MADVATLDIGPESLAARKRGQTKIRALIIKAAKSSPGGSKALSEKEQFGPYTEQIVPPLYDPTALVRLGELSSDLGPAIDVMAENIEGFGYRFLPRVPTTGLSEAEKREMADEREMLVAFFEGAGIDQRYVGLQKKKRTDLEYTGDAYWEVVKGQGSLSDRIVGFTHLPSYQMRMTLEGDELVPVDYPRVTIHEGKPELVTARTYRRFRRFIQGHIYWSGGTMTGKQRWFKEFGDPRVLDNQTGEYVAEDDLLDFRGTGKPMPEDRKASEVIHWSFYWPTSPYGMPRWIGNALAILGVRRAQEVNFFTLDNNNIPSMMILVSGGGRVTDKTIERIKEFSEINASDDNRTRFLLLEAEGEIEDAEGLGSTDNVKIDVKPLTDVQIKDVLFGDYLKTNQHSIYRSFRFPMMFVGETEGLNRATADILRKLTDEQVFQPEREEGDWVINYQILPNLGAKWWRYVTKTPNVTDNKELIAMLAAVERTGGSNARIARAIIEDVFPLATEVSPPIDEAGFNVDMPFSLVMAEAVKAMGGTAGPTEIGQTIAPVQPSGVVKSGLGPDELILRLMEIGDRHAAEVRKRIERMERDDTE